MKTLLFILLCSMPIFLSAQDYSTRYEEFCEEHNAYHRNGVCQASMRYPPLSAQTHRPATIWWKMDKRAMQKHASDGGGYLINLRENLLTMSLVIRIKRVALASPVATSTGHFHHTPAPASPIRLELRHKRGELLESTSLTPTREGHLLTTGGLPDGKYTLRIFEEDSGELLQAYKCYVWGSSRQ